MPDHPAIEAVLQSIEGTTTPLSEHDIQRALSQARESLKDPTEDENFGAWADVLAFTVCPVRSQVSPWGTYFGPMGSGTDKDGKTFYVPDISIVDRKVVDHWCTRARLATHPVLKARYADLAWDMCAVIPKARRDPEMARLAIDAYIVSVSLGIRSRRHGQFAAALRALDLAIMIRDADRIERARATLLQLHRQAVAERSSQAWIAFDRLIEEKNGGVTEAERQQLAEDLDGLMLHYSDTSNPRHFDPHLVESAAGRLIQYYRRLGRPDDVRRLHLAVGRAFEHFAGLGDAMLASAVLQTAINAYRDAGMPDESRRARILMEEKIGQSRAQMASFETEVQIPHEDIEAFLSVVVDDPGVTFVRIAAKFLPNRSQLEEEVQKTLEQAPLMARITQKIMADDHVAAQVGSVEDDPFGRLLRQATMHFELSAIWLNAALHRAIERHNLSFEHFAGWANRHGLYEDLTFVIEGIHAWLEGDNIKAVHVLVPQIEHGLRSIVAQLGKPVTKPHATVPGVGVAFGMGDILYSDELTQALGPDLTLHFLALYADPRGMNLRNRVAHGLIKPEATHTNVVELLIHTLLVFGAWREFAQSRR
jgi:Domain of unknown function (DUF4209)